ncbi:MAG: beta strand repeat-containing protein, partial [Betaproteobacteria bacterium]
DSLDGGAGNDLLSYAGASGAVTVDMAAGAATASADSITGFESVLGSGFSDSLVGESAANGLFGEDGNDTINAGGGNDIVLGGNGSDSLAGADGTDSLLGEAGSDSLSGGEDADLLSGGADADALNGGNGADSLDGGTGADSLSGDAGNDTLSGGEDADLLSGGADADALNGGNGADSLDGGSGADSLFGDAGNDTLSGGEDADLLSGGADADALNGGNGADSLDGGSGADSLSGDAGNDTLSGGEDADVLAGGADADALNGGNGADSLDGGTGADTLAGGEGADTLVGGAGNDFLDGGSGSDLYLIADGAGTDTINDSGGTDTLSFLGTTGGSISAASLGAISGVEAINLAGGGNTLNLSASRVVALSDNDVLRVFGNGTDRLFFDDAGSWTGGSAVGGFITFTSGGATVIAAEGLIPGVTPGDDSLVGTSGADTIDLLAGNDSYVGLDGNDSIIGNDGNDSLSGDAGADSIQGGNGADFINGGAGQDNIQGGIGNDTISGGNDADSILGNAGADSLYGDDSTDTISGGDDADAISGGGGADQLIGGSGNDLLNGDNGSDFANYSANTSAQAISVDLGSGRANDGLGGTDTLLSIENVWGGAGNDTIIGGTGADNFLGNSGNDSLAGGAGANTLDGGSGDDTIVGGDGNERIFGANGSDSIDAGAGTGDVISFNHTSAQAVSATISAIGGTGGSNYAEVRTASQGNDTIINFENIEGSWQDDGFTIDGAATDNALLFVLGSIGNDTIAANIASNAVMANYDVAAGALNFTRGVIVDLNAGTADDGRGGIDSLIGVRGVSGSSFGDTILGSGFNDRFRENGGSDSINGRDGLDMLDYSGNSTSQHVSVNLAAERATDGRGGTDTVISMEYARGGAGNDTLIGNDADNELRGGSGADILDGGASGFDVADYANNTSAQAISVNLVAQFADDGRGSNDTLLSIEYVRGGAGNDTIIGSAANERFRGNAGSDSMDGGDGTEDILDLSQTNAAVSANLVTGRANDGLGGTDSFSNIEGVYSGTAADTLIGGSGNDYFDGGMGGDRIDGGAGADRVRYYLVSGNNSSVTGGVSVNLVAERATDGWGGQDTLIGIERVSATNFADTLLGDGVANRFAGLAGDDTIDGGLASDWLEYIDSSATSGVTVNLAAGTASDGRGGTDSFTSIENVIGGSFGDRLTGIAQDGRTASRLRGGAGNDTLIGIEDEFVVADYADQTKALSVNLASGSVNDGLGGIDSLVNIRGAAMFGNYADTLIGSNGDDWLDPSGGSDSVMGGDGYDRIVYSGTPSGGVSVNLAAGVASDGDGGTDTLIGFEAVSTGYSNDTVIGDSNDNIVGLSAGADYADGAGGIDMVDYAVGYSPNVGRYTSNEAGDQLPFNGVTIDLAAGRATDQGGSTDTILNFEDAFGSTMHDSILGSAGDNYLDGAEGNDTINGGGGNDEISSDQGTDSLFGGDGDDNLYA